MLLSDGSDCSNTPTTVFLRHCRSPSAATPPGRRHRPPGSRRSSSGPIYTTKKWNQLLSREVWTLDLIILRCSEIMSPLQHCKVEYVNWDDSNIPIGPHRTLSEGSNGEDLLTPESSPMGQSPPSKLAKLVFCGIFKENLPFLFKTRVGFTVNKLFEVRDSNNRMSFSKTS